MKLVYERLFDHYCDLLLQENGSFDEYALEQRTAFLGLEAKERRKLMDLLLDLHQQWALDGFAAGLQLGLSLRSEPPARKREHGSEVRRRGLNGPALRRR